MVTVENIHFAYGNTPILTGVSLSFAQGSFSAIVGANGCGKSTLFAIMSRVYKPHQGQIKIDGVDIYDVPPPPRQQAQKMSVLSQVGVLPEFMSVHDMVMQGRFCYQSFLSRYRLLYNWTSDI